MNPSALFDQLIALPPIGRAIVASTLLLGFAGLTAAFAWRAAASLRHALWLVALGAAIGAAVVSFTGPTVRVDVSPITRLPIPIVNEITNIGTGVSSAASFAPLPTSQLQP